LHINYVEASDDDDADDYDDGDLKARLDALQDERTKELSSLALSICIDDGVVTFLPEVSRRGDEWPGSSIQVGYYTLLVFPFITAYIQSYVSQY